MFKSMQFLLHPDLPQTPKQSETIQFLSPHQATNDASLEASTCGVSAARSHLEQQGGGGEGKLVRELFTLRKVSSGVHLAVEFGQEVG